MSTEGSWDCTVCTYINENKHNNCQMCENLEEKEVNINDFADFLMIELTEIGKNTEDDCKRALNDVTSKFIDINSDESKSMSDAMDVINSAFDNLRDNNTIYINQTQQSVIHWMCNYPLFADNIIIYAKITAGIIEKLKAFFCNLWKRITKLAKIIWNSIRNGTKYISTKINQFCASIKHGIQNLLKTIKSKFIENN